VPASSANRGNMLRQNERGACQAVAQKRQHQSAAAKVDAVSARQPSQVNNGSVTFPRCRPPNMVVNRSRFTNATKKPVSAMAFICGKSLASERSAGPLQPHQPGEGMGRFGRSGPSRVPPGRFGPWAQRPCARRRSTTSARSSGNPNGNCVIICSECTQMRLLLRPPPLPRFFTSVILEVLFPCPPEPFLSRAAHAG